MKTLRLFALAIGLIAAASTLAIGRQPSAAVVGGNPLLECPGAPQCPPSVR